MFMSGLIPGFATIQAGIGPVDGIVPVSRRSRILVLEGDDALRQAILNALGIAVPAVCARTGVEALALMKAQAPTMALLNMQIEDMDGAVLLRQVRLRLPAAKVIVTSDSGDYDLVRTVNEIGVGDFLEKPYRLDHLFHAVDNSVRGVHAPIDFRSLSARYHEQSRLRRQRLLNFA